MILICADGLQHGKRTAYDRP